MTRAVLVVTSLLAVACKSESASPKEKQVEPEITQLAGVWPDKFACSSVVTDADLQGVLGGTVKQIDNPVQMPKGLAHPCKYEVSGTVAELWSFDFDCRDNYKTTADALFAQYREKNAELIAEWNKQSDAGMIKPNDAGIVNKAPGAPTEVQVGLKGLDHHGNSLLFIDDDAPCYVRISGIDEARRLELAKLLAKNLTFMNAPMTPRRPQ